MKKKVYQAPKTEIIFVEEESLLMAGSVRNDDQKIFEGDPDPSKVDEGDQNSHPADSKAWGGSSWSDWDDWNG